MLICKDISKKYIMGKNEVLALDKINIEINKGDIIGLKGPSGSGKSTLLNIIGLLDNPTSGEFYINNERVDNLSQNKRTKYRAKYLGFIFQNFNLIPELTAFENVEIPLLITGVPEKIRKQKVMEILKEVGLDSRAKHKPGELSGGQQQRVAIARALVKAPPLVIADEPTANLDSKTGMKIIELLIQLNTKNNSSIVIASHDDNISKMIDKIYNLLDGKIQ